MNTPLCQHNAPEDGYPRCYGEATVELLDDAYCERCAENLVSDGTLWRCVHCPDVYTYADDDTWSQGPDGPECVACTEERAREAEADAAWERAHTVQVDREAAATAYAIVRAEVARLRVEARSLRTSMMCERAVRRLRSLLTVRRLLRVAIYGEVQHV